MWELDNKKGWASKNGCLRTVVLEKTWGSLGQQGDQTSQSERKSTLNIHWKDWCWSSNTLATWCKELTHWKRSWYWERLKAEGDGGERDQDGWMASLKGREFEQTPGDGEGQGILVCCSPWGPKESDTTERLNNKEWREQAGAAKRKFLKSVKVGKNKGKLILLCKYSRLSLSRR